MLAAIARVHHAFAIPQSTDNGAATLFAEDIAVRLAIVRGKATGGAAEEFMAGFDQFVVGIGGLGSTGRGGHQQQGGEYGQKRFSQK